MGRPVTAAMAVECIDLLQLPSVNPATIRQWAKRDKVRTYGLDQHGLQKYELSDIIRMVSSGDQTAHTA